MITGKIVAVDFDGTITDNSPYPVMGKLRKNCKEALDFIHQNNVIVLWTCRTGKFLQQALRFIEQNEIPIDSVNCINSSYRDSPRKIIADIFIDDKNIFCKEIDWLKIKRFFE